MDPGFRRDDGKSRVIVSPLEPSMSSWPAIHEYHSSNPLSVIAGLDPAIHAKTVPRTRRGDFTHPDPTTEVLLNRHGMDPGSRRFAACPG
jgi:hypothetical protein